LGANGELFVTDSDRQDVQVFGADGKRLGKVDGKKKEELDLPLPRGIAVDASGHLFVSCQDGFMGREPFVVKLE